MRYFSCLLFFLISSPVIYGSASEDAGAITSLRVEKDLSVTLIVYRLATRQLIEWPTKLNARSSAITGLQVDDDGRYVVFETRERLSPIDGGAPPFVYALDLRDQPPVRRFLGPGSGPQISADGRRIVFTRTVNGVLSTVSLDTHDWQLDVCEGRPQRRRADDEIHAMATSSTRSPHKEWMVPLLPVDDSLIREWLVLVNPNSDETVVTARLQRGFLAWRRRFSLPAHTTLNVDPAELRRGTDATLVGLSAPLPITAEYRVEATRSGRPDRFGIPALNPDTTASRLVFSSAWPGTLVLANLDERLTRVRITVVDAQGSVQKGTVQIVTVKPRDLSFVDLAAIPAGQVRVEALDQGQVAGTLIIRDGS